MPFNAYFINLHNCVLLAVFSHEYFISLEEGIRLLLQSRVDSCEQYCPNPACTHFLFGCKKQQAANMIPSYPESVC